jgi:hypothetical protein
MNKAALKVGNVVLSLTFFDTPTAKAVYDSLPLDSEFTVWGDEFFIDIPVDMTLDDNATDTVAVGDIGYWPPGNALAIFFGPTPLSTGAEPMAASPVNLVGRIEGDSKKLKEVKDAGRLSIKKT